MECSIVFVGDVIISVGNAISLSDVIFVSLLTKLFCAMGAAGRLNVLPRQGLLLTLSPCELELSTTVFCNVPLKLPPSVGVNRCNILLMVIVTIQFAPIF